VVRYGNRETIPKADGEQRKKISPLGAPDGESLKRMTGRIVEEATKRNKHPTGTQKRKGGKRTRTESENCVASNKRPKKENNPVFGIVPNSQKYDSGPYLALLAPTCVIEDGPLLVGKAKNAFPGALGSPLSRPTRPSRYR